MDKSLCLKRLYDQTSRQRSIVGKIMEALIIEQYPLGTEAIIFDQLLEWSLWPVFITIFSNIKVILTSCILIYTCTTSIQLGKEQQKVKVSNLPGHCASLTSSAYHTLHDICTKLSTGDVLVEDLHKMLQHQNQMERLCSAVDNKTFLKKQDFKGFLACRLNELHQFKLRQDQLKFICSQISIRVTGTLRNDYTKIKAPRVTVYSEQPA